MKAMLCEYLRTSQCYAHRLWRNFIRKPKPVPISAAVSVQP